MLDKKCREKGLHGEKLCREFLSQKGYKIIAQNYYSAYGEIDVIALDKNILVFIEVKSRQAGLSTALTSVSHPKQLKLNRTAADFLSKEPRYAEFFTRFDVMAVHPTGDTYKIHHLIDAFRIE